MVIAIPVVLLAVVAAVIALLIVLAAPAVSRLLHAVFDSIPVVGGSIASAIDSVINAVGTALWDWADTAVVAMARALWAPMVSLWQLGERMVNVSATITDAVARLKADAQAWVQYAVNLAQGWVQYALDTAHSLFSKAEADMTAAVGALGNLAQAWVANAVNLAQAWVANATNLAQAWVAQLRTDATGWVDALRSDARSWFDQAQADTAAVEAAAMGAISTLAGQVTADVAAAESHAISVAGALASQAATGAVGALDQAAHDVVVGPWSAILSPLGDIVTHLPSDVAQAIPGLGSLPATLPLTVPAILGALAPAIAATTTEVARCTVPMCDNLGGLSNLFAGLGEAATWALVVALVAEAATHPGQAAADMKDVLYAPSMALMGGIRDLVGV